MIPLMRWLWWRPPCLLRTVILNVRDDQNTAIQGVLWASRGAWLVIRNPQLLNAAREPAPMDGEVVIHRTHVAFIQVVP
jgi:hypothetical protein